MLSKVFFYVRAIEKGCFVLISNSQQNPHLSSQHLHAGRDPSGRVSQEGWSKHQAQDIWHQVQELHFHWGDVGDGCKKWLYKVLHFRDKPMWDLGVTIHSPWNAWSWDVEVEDRDVSPAKRGMGWLRSKCRSIGSKEQSSLCLCLKPPKLCFIQPCIVSIHFLFHLHWPSQGYISIWRFTRLRWVE